MEEDESFSVLMAMIKARHSDFEKPLDKQMLLKICDFYDYYTMSFTNTMNELIKKCDISIDYCRGSIENLRFFDKLKTKLLMRSVTRDFNEYFDFTFNIVERTTLNARKAVANCDQKSLSKAVVDFTLDTVDNFKYFHKEMYDLYDDIDKIDIDLIEYYVMIKKLAQRAIEIVNDNVAVKEDFQKYINFFNFERGEEDNYLC